MDIIDQENLRIQQYPLDEVQEIIEQECPADENGNHIFTTTELHYFISAVQNEVFNKRSE